MTDFQKELALLGVCLAFFFVFFDYAETVANGNALIAQMITVIRTMFNA